MDKGGRRVGGFHQLALSNGGIVKKDVTVDE